MGSDRQNGPIVRSEGLVGRQPVDELLVDVLALEVGLLARALSLATQDRDELGSGLEEATALTDRLVSAVELGRPDTAAIAEQTLMPVCEHLGIAIDRGWIRERFDDLGGREVLLGHNVI